MGRYTVHGGHAKQGNKFSGAVGFCSESVVDRAICQSVIKWLTYAGHTAYDCTVDSGISQGNIISQIKKKINSHKNVECNISIHLNAATKSKADGKVKGAEVLVYSTNTDDAYIANRVVLELRCLGFTNRGVKRRTDLGVLKGITNGGKNILVECFFCDDQDDYNLFNKLGVDAIGKAIAMGVLGKAIPTLKSTKVTTNTTVKPVVENIDNSIDFSRVFNAAYYKAKYQDKEPAFKTATDKQLLEHFMHFGMSEGRQACASFNVKVYKERYLDLQAEYGDNLPKYYQHYCLLGYKEGRSGV